MRTPQKVIFDMDGLIFDSERIFMHELGEVIKDYGYEMRREDYIQTLGLTGEALKEKVLSIYGEDYPHKLMSRMARDRVDALALSDGLPIKEGIIDLLKYLKSKGVSCVVASSTHRQYVERYLKAAGLSDFFDHVIGGDQVDRSKPEPDIFIKALGETDPKQALVLEDSRNGIIAASRADIPVICIPDMVYPTEDIAALTAAIADSAKEVIKMIDENRVLSDIEPLQVMKYFEDISSIPHGSKNTDMIADYCMDFAKTHDLEAIRDKSNNIIIKKPRTSDCTSNKTIIIQGHLDMVCAKAPDRDINFKTDGLRLNTDGEYIWADGTTLGGDDGIAIAMALAILASDDITHPALECVFTTDEEIGMLGATELDMSQLCGDLLLNIDSEDEGIFTVSCAGGARLKAVFDAAPYSPQFDTSAKITVGGLTGGHSGMEIDKGRANACTLLGNILAAVKKQHDFALIEINGGEKDNAIPRSASTIISVNDYDKFANTIASVERLYKVIHSSTDPDMYISTEKVSYQGPALQSSILSFLVSVPNGVRTMSEDINGLVKTSSNLGIIETDGNKITATLSVRSSSAKEKAELLALISSIVKKCGGTVSVSGDYPAWEYRADSVLRDTCVDVFHEQYGREPEISAIHAGLECGIFCGKRPELDCISFGPDILDIHTPKERLDIKSTQRVYEFLKELLRRL